MLPIKWRYWLKLARNSVKQVRHIYRPVLEQFEDRIVPTGLSIPTNLTAMQGKVVMVPIVVDTLNDKANGNIGLGSGEFDLFYNPSVFSVSSADIGIGTISSPNLNDTAGTALGDGYSPTAIQALTFSSGVTGGSFTLNFNGATTAPITYSPVPATLAANIQTALDATIGPGDTLVNAPSATNATITFQGQDFGMAAPTTTADGTNLAGANPSVMVDTTAYGPNGWSASLFQAVPGFLDIRLTNDNTGIIFNTGGGSLVVVNFHILLNAAVGLSMIDLAGDSVNSGITNGFPTTTNITDQNQNPFTIPTPQDNTLLNPYQYLGMDSLDGVVNVTPAVPHFAVTGPPQILPGEAFPLTVTAEDADNNANPGYSGTIQFSSSDTLAGLPASATMTNGIGIFSANSYDGRETGDFRFRRHSQHAVRGQQHDQCHWHTGPFRLDRHYQCNGRQRLQLHCHGAKRRRQRYHQLCWHCAFHQQRQSDNLACRRDSGKRSGFLRSGAQVAWQSNSNRDGQRGEQFERH